jgi:hypothetical protein
MVAVCLVLVMQRSETLRSVFSNQEAVKEGKAHLGLDEDGHAVAVLSLMFSILAVVLVALGPSAGRIAAPVQLCGPKPRRTLYLSLRL